MSIQLIHSTIRDGSMLLHTDKSDKVIINNRQKFLKSYGLDIRRTTRVNIAYEGDDYSRYYTLTETDYGKGMRGDDFKPYDALVTTEKNTPLFLALADCVGAVIYDPERELCMMSHLGRHSIEQNGGLKSIDYLVRIHGSNPAKLLVTLSPSAGKMNYPLTSFGGRSMQDVVCDQLSQAGVAIEHIQTSSVDTTTSLDLYSHSEYLKQNREDDGRFAIVAVMTD